jgi:glycosyltransferase involved in cell wall biosynthesis
MKDNLDISVVIPVYNSNKTIIRAIDSIINQTILPKEIIIVDDKSTDNTIEIINSYINKNNKDITIRLISLKENSGPSKARNTGWNNSESEYIAFLDSDDSWHPQKLEIQYSFMKENHDIKLCGHLMEISKNNLPNINKIDIRNINSIEITEKMLLNKNYFTTTSNVMIKNDIELRFDENMRYAEDYYLWLEITFKYNTILINYPLGYAYKSFTGVSGLSGNLLAMYKGSLQIAKILLDKKKINLPTYIYRVIIRTIKLIFVTLKKIKKDNKND